MENTWMYHRKDVMGLCFNEEWAKYQAPLRPLNNEYARWCLCNITNDQYMVEKYVVRINTIVYSCLWHFEGRIFT